MKLLILRPRPGADATAARARALGLDPVIAPLFFVQAVDWTVPGGPFDAVMLTSANAARNAGDGMAPFLDLPCYAVGEATALAAQEAGFTAVRTGPADGSTLLTMMADDDVRRVLHPCGADHAALYGPGIEVADVIVYAAEPVAELPTNAQRAIQDGALALLHSPRAASLFAGLAEDKTAIRIAAISKATAVVAGPGWASVDVAARPRDEALLELAAKLCQTGGR